MADKMTRAENGQVTIVMGQDDWRRVTEKRLGESKKKRMILREMRYQEWRRAFASACERPDCGRATRMGDYYSADWREWHEDFV